MEPATDARRLVLEAASFAARAHHGQMRKDNATPYVSHVFRVCLVVRDVFGFHDAATLTAALLHDVGHLVHHLGENPAGQGIDDRHEQIGHDYLAQWFGPEVTEPVRLHVAAKRYLCSIEPDYLSKLSKDSVLSLSLQGGLMSKSEMDAFRAQRYHKAAIQLRRYDEMAKVKDLATPPTDYFLGFVSACLKRER